MPRLTTILAIVIVGVLVLSGVLEVKLNPDKVGNIPGVVNGAKSGNFGSIGRVATSLKRKGEVFFTDSATERLQKHLTFIGTDADKLNTLLNEPQPKAEDLLGQATLLVQSLEDARQQAATIEPEQLVSLQDQSSAAIASAKQALTQLYALQEQYQFNQERLTEITKSVELNLGQLDTPEEESDEGEVAGTADKTNEDSNESELQNSLPAVPLRF